ncbi:acyltransferase domain-containing protein [Candidatus Poribacteria bacterium]
MLLIDSMTMDDNAIHEKLQQFLDKGTLGAEWGASQESMPADGLPFLDLDAIAEACQWAGFDAGAISYLQSAAERIASDPVLARLAWHCHHLLCRSKSYRRGDSGSWPPLEELLGQWSGAFYLLIALSGLPQARAFHQSRGIPEHIARDTYSDTFIWASNYRGKQGVWGMYPRALPWLFHHLKGDLFWLVRLEFMQRPFRQKLQAFRNRATRQVMVLAESGTRYRSDGQLDGTGREFDPEGGWTSRLLIDQDQVIGTPIHPTGIALREEVALPLDEWECVLASGDPILEIHIPAGSPLDLNSCRASFRLAVDFFPRYFPDRPFKALCCGSWLLNTQFQDMLPPNSNIVRFQGEFYLYPILSGGRSGLHRIFESDNQDLATAPRDTTLRRAVLDHLQAGGYLRGGGGLIFAEDLNRGRQVYQSRVGTAHRKH